MKRMMMMMRSWRSVGDTSGCCLLGNPTISRADHSCIHTYMLNIIMMMVIMMMVMMTMIMMTPLPTH